MEAEYFIDDGLAQGRPVLVGKSMTHQRHSGANLTTTSSSKNSLTSTSLASRINPRISQYPRRHATVTKSFSNR